MAERKHKVLKAGQSSSEGLWDEHGQEESSSTRGTSNRRIVVGNPELRPRRTNPQAPQGPRQPVERNGSSNQDNGRTEEGGVNSQRSDSFTLKPHQQYAVEFLGRAELKSRLLGDEMRVGKTPTAIGFDLSLREQVDRKKRGNNCTLVVCPKSALGVWRSHLIWMGIPQSSITVIDLPSKQAFKTALGQIAAKKRMGNARVRYVVLNWDAVHSLKKELGSAGPWFHIIGDEIHRIKGRETKRTSAFKRLATKYKTGLSGTPADNKPEDFWSVLNWLRPSEYGSYWAFVDEYCKVRVTKTGFKTITGVKTAALPKLRERMAPFYLRRMLADVADSLPQKQYRTEIVQMGAKQRREYDEFDKKQIVEIDGGDMMAAYDVSVIARKQQMAIGCCAGTWIRRKVRDKETKKWAEEAYFDVHITDDPPSPKLNRVMEIVEDEPELGPFLIFAQHHDTVRLTRARLQRAGYKVSSIIGTDGPDERTASVEAFQRGRTDVFVGSIGACRESITLNRANCIIFIDRNWNPNANRQAEARADALDSNLPVTVIVIQAENSIDEARRLRIDQKGRDTDAIISGASS